VRRSKTTSCRWPALLVIAGAILGSAPAKLATARAASDQPSPSAVQLATANQAIEDPALVPAKAALLVAADEKFLDDLEQRGVNFFVVEADPTTGLMPDRAKATGGAKDVASIASVGFGLSALCVGDKRGWVSHQEAYDHALKVLRFLRDREPAVHGFYYHFLNMHTGERVWNCEVSSIDTALLMAGVLTVRQHFQGTELATIADGLYQRVEWPWMSTPDGTLAMGWKPDQGFTTYRWSSFNEGPLIYLLGLGSRDHALSPQAWRAWRRDPIVTYAGLTFIQCPPLFTQQYPQAWFDLRGMRDDYADYFRNSQLATLAQRQWCVDELSKQFPTYGPNIWGITASDGPHGYLAWGGPPAQGEIDGSVVPCAVAGSLAFEPRLCLDALEAMRQRYGDKAYLKYGFVDAFNPGSGWYDADVLGIDVGPTVLMAENCRSGFVWQTFMSSPEPGAALKAAGFRLRRPQDGGFAATSIFNGKGDNTSAGIGG
jgi:hypothetical protein